LAEAEVAPEVIYDFDSAVIEFGVEATNRLGETVEKKVGKKTERVLKYPDGLKQILKLSSSGAPTGGSKHYKSPLSLVGQQGIGMVGPE
jgi:hypothetical protein